MRAPGQEHEERKPVFREATVHEKIDDHIRRAGEGHTGLRTTYNRRGLGSNS